MLCANSKIHKIPNSKPTSPILLTTIAFIAALLADILVNQKLISKYEHKPTPSQPKNKTIKLSDAISINIKKVNSDRYDINRGTCAS